MLLFDSSEYTQSVFEVVLTTEYARRLPSLDHDSGTCAIPWSGVVNRSAFEEPSLRWRKIAGAPSRSDWNAREVPSGDQTGNRFLPSPGNVRGRIEVSRVRSWIEIARPFASSEPSAS